MRNAIIGLVVGFALGWLVFGQSERTDRAERKRAERAEESAGQPQGTPKPDEPAPESRPHLVEQVETAKPNELRLLAHRLATPVAEEVVQAALVRLEKAQADKDWELFRSAVEFLARTKSPAARAKLIELVGDTSIRFHDWRIAGPICDGLRGTRTDGAAAAARDRIEMEAKAYRDKNRQTGWFEIVAAQGTPADIEWLIQRGAVNREETTAVYIALGLAAADDYAADALIRIWKEWGDPWSSGDAAKLLIDNNRPKALAFFRERFLTGAKNGARFYGDAVSEETLADAKATLLSLRDPIERTRAVYAVTRMQRNNLDISGLEPIVNAPVELAHSLVNADQKAIHQAYYDVLYGIEYNKVTWSEDAANALDALAHAYENKSRAEAYTELAREIRAKLGKGNWKTSD